MLNRKCQKRLALTGVVKARVFNPETLMYVCRLTGQDSRGRVRQFIAADMDEEQAEAKVDGMLWSAGCECIQKH